MIRRGFGGSRATSNLNNHAVPRECDWLRTVNVKYPRAAETSNSIKLRLLFLFKRCGLWTPSCDFVARSEGENKKSLIAAHLYAEVILLVTV